jgi:recombinational DNA repair ATPase RecF
VKVTNFMCHHNLEVELGPRINFIVGENGSGRAGRIFLATS